MIDELRPLNEVMQPDPRSSRSLETVHERLSAIEMHPSVPEKVRQLFETAKNVSLYAHFVYRFHQVAILLSCTALELALKTKAQAEAPEMFAKREPTLGLLLLRAKKDGWLRKEQLPTQWLIARRKAGWAAVQRNLVGEAPTAEPTDADVLLEMQSFDLVEVLIEMLPHIRNHHAHGSTSVEMSSAPWLRRIGEILNALFPNEKAP